MLFLEILITIILAIFIGAIFYYVFKTTGPWGSFWTFLVILILAGLAAEAWITPMGPVYWDVAWIPTLFVILLFALILAAATPPARDLRTREMTDVPEGSGDQVAAVALGTFFWILMLFLFIAAIWGIFS